MTKKIISLGHQIIKALTFEQIESLIDAIGSETLLGRLCCADIIEMTLDIWKNIFRVSFPIRLHRAAIIRVP